MDIYLSASSKYRGDLCRDLGFGIIYSPAHPQKIRDDIKHIIDNVAWTAFVKKEPWDEVAFYRYLERAKNPEFVIIPDIVAGGTSSLSRSAEHIDRIKFPMYLAVQNGMNAGDTIKFIPYIDGYFVGGSMDWKLKTSEYWCKFAHNNGKKCHIGRVGTKKMYAWAKYIGADSVDGSTPVRHNKIHLIPEWIDDIKSIVRLSEFGFEV